LASSQLRRGLRNALVNPILQCLLQFSAPDRDHYKNAPKVPMLLALDQVAPNALSAFDNAKFASGG
jgi:hypothetical protein